MATYYIDNPQALPPKIAIVGNPMPTQADFDAAFAVARRVLDVAGSFCEVMNAKTGLTYRSADFFCYRGQPISDSEVVTMVDRLTAAGWTAQKGKPAGILL